MENIRTIQVDDNEEIKTIVINENNVLKNISLYNLLKGDPGTTNYNDLTNKPFEPYTATTEIVLLNDMYDGNQIHNYKATNNFVLDTEGYLGQIEIYEGDEIKIGIESCSIFTLWGSAYLWLEEGVWNGDYYASFSDVNNAVDAAFNNFNNTFETKYTIATQASTTGAVQMVANRFTIKTNPVTQFGLTIPNTISNEYKSKLAIKTASNYTEGTVFNPTRIKSFIGEDCEDGVFTPKANKTYLIEAVSNGYSLALVKVMTPTYNVATKDYVDNLIIGALESDY